MAFKDFLLHLTSYPDPTPVAAVEQAVNIAQAMGAHLSALACEIVIRVPGTVLAPALINVKGLIAAEHHKSASNAHALIDAFEHAAAQRDLGHDHFIESCENSQVPEIVAEYARLSDLTMIPLGPDAGFQQHVAETIIFGSGRPTLIYPPTATAARSGAFDTVGVAWDFSRPAARAVADAMPFLERAKTVRIVTITEEKPIKSRRSGAELARHLAFHGINVVSDTESAAGRPVGQVIEDYATARGLDLLVMGAYGHTRFREFILGGATHSVLAKPPLPVLLSH
jgi:nucleotide-binding universal stress UspA family protein